MKYSVLICFFTHTLFSFNLIASSNDSVKVDNKVINQWNKFVDDIYQLHLKQIKDRNITTSKRSGSYHRLPDFFQEIKFFDSKSNTLLSRIEWETAQPEKIHSIEVLVHDKDNKIIREYFASYLPKYRNAPYQTLINLHHYSNSLHSFRQFDASSNLIYEVCKSIDSKEKLFEHDDYEIPENFTQGAGKNQTYQECFQQLPRSAGQYLLPH